MRNLGAIDGAALTRFVIGPFAGNYTSVGINPCGDYCGNYWGDYLDINRDIGTIATNLRQTWRERGDIGN